MDDSDIGLWESDSNIWLVNELHNAGTSEYIRYIIVTDSVLCFCKIWFLYIYLINIT